MNRYDFLQIVAVLGVIVLLTPILGQYMADVFQNQKTIGTRFLRPIEILILRLSGVDETKELDLVCRL